MNLEQKVMTALKTAMKEKNEVALRTLRAIKAAILVEKTNEGASGEITGEQELRLLQKMAKQRKESATIFHQQNRADLAQKEEDELTILETFLPASLSANEISEIISSIIKEMGASGPQDIGKIIGAANKKMAGQAEGKAIADEVKKQLSSL